MNLVLLGFHGSGKTVVGKVLADRLWSSFLDVDETLAAQMAERGEDPQEYLPHVQAGQRALLAELKADGADVVAASSIAVPDGPTLAALKARGRLVYLKADPAALAERVAADLARQRGLYPHFRRAELADIPAALARRDGPWAAMADLTLDTTPMPIETVVRLVIRMAM